MDLLHLDQETEPTLKRASITGDTTVKHHSDIEFHSYTSHATMTPLEQSTMQFTGSKSSEIQKIVSFLVIGGSASLINLIFVFILDKFASFLPFFAISIVATEISLIFNFYLNDRFTFRSMLASTNRTWLQRCIRFHGPASIGFGLTLLIANFAKHGLHFSSVISQATAIAIVTVVNFIMHRYWTFRPTNNPTSHQHA